MFDLRDTERLAAWKSFRHQLETETYPFQSVCNFWSKAPFVNPYLKFDDPSSWPDPWHLILDNKYDDLAIVLGMLYTLKLTDRFSNNDLEIYMSVELKEKRNPIFFLVVDNYILNLEYNSVSDISKMKEIETMKIYSSISMK